jgi:predicted  nucleic acid-binding Zn-ribbon protein
MRAPRAALIVAGCSLAVSASKVTPIEKVMELMKKLSAEVTEQGKVEAEQYDKYACFCKEQADEKLYNIEKSESIIKKQTAKISKLETEISELNTEINDLTVLIEDKEAEIKAAEEERAEQHEKYLAVDKDMAAAIKGIKGAIKALKDSKNKMKGDADLDLMQLKSLAGQVLRVVHPKALTQKQHTALVQMSEPGKAHAFEYQSNDIIAVLEGLKDQFLENKKELDESEFETNAAFERKRLGLQNEVKFAAKDRAEKEEILEGKEEELHATQEAKGEENSAMGSDQAFLDQLTSECETKAADWDQRSKARADELKALSEALTTLEEGAAGQYAANKKLNLAQKPTSFLQLRGTTTEALQMAAAARAQIKLVKDAKALHSPVLSVTAMKVKLLADHFVKVRGIIKDLIEKLEADAEAEATQKGFCDENMAAALQDRDTSNAQIEEAMATISKLEAEKAELQTEIEDLKKAIANNLKALNEATELRNAEKAENQATVETATEGKNAVDLAISILKDFYDNAFIQTKKYVPPNSDRSGKTVGDMAPEAPSGSYHGNQGASKGILGLLDVILSDFERTIETTEDAEAAAQASFDQFEADTNADNEAKETEIDTKTKRIADIEDELVETTEDKDDASTLKKNALAELEKLKPMCVEGEETYEERVAKREKEIQSLKDAMEMLDNWQK